METFVEFPDSCVFGEDKENMRSSCDCGYLRGKERCSQDCRNVALNLPAVFACVYRFQPFIGAMRFQPFVVVLLALCVASSISRRQRACAKGMGKDYKGEKELNCFQDRKIEAQAVSLIPVGILWRRAGGEKGVFH